MLRLTRSEAVRSPTTLRVAVAVAWVAAVLATQAWPSWQTGVRDEFASDVTAYEPIAAAAPGLPNVRLREQHAQRFAPHWLLGTVADATGAPRHGAYRVATIAVLAATVLLLVATIAGALEPRAWALALGAFVASAYPVRYLLAAPGMLGDAVFLLGVALCLLGTRRRSAAVAVAGLLVAVSGRQTAVPVALALAALVATAPGQGFRRRDALPLALLPLGLFLVLRTVAASFSKADLGGLSDFTVLGALDEPGALVSHLGRTALPLLVPGVLLAAAWFRRTSRAPLVPLVMAAAVVVQPLVLSPDWVAQNEPRLAALALPALAVAIGALLSGVRLGTGETLAAAAGLLVASLHHRYAAVGATDSATWLAVLLVGTVAACTLLLPAARGRAPARARRRGVAGPT